MPAIELATTYGLCDTVLAGRGALLDRAGPYVGNALPVRLLSQALQPARTTPGIRFVPSPARQLAPSGQRARVHANRPCHRIRLQPKNSVMALSAFRVTCSPAPQLTAARVINVKSFEGHVSDT